MFSGWLVHFADGEWLHDAQITDVVCGMTIQTGTNSQCILLEICDEKATILQMDGDIVR